MKRSAPYTEEGRRKQICNGERLYTLSEVNMIVTKAIDEKAATLRKIYDQMLTERLQEQYAQFSRYNQDHNYRRNDDMSYII
jgi:hypothetical protein